MKNPNDISNELMLKFLSDTATAEEREAMETWMVDSEENAKYIEQLKSLWANAESFSLLDSIDLDQNWQGVQSKVNQQKAGNSKIFWRIAAAVVFIVSASFLASLLGLILNAIKIAFEALAKETSVSVIIPTSE